MKLENVTVVMNEYLEEKKGMKPFLPVASKVLLVSALLLMIDNFIDLPSALNVCAFILVLVCSVFTLARNEFFMLTVALFLRFADYFYNFLYFLIRWREVSASYVIYAAFYGLLLWLSYRKSKELGMVPDKIEKKVSEVSGKAQETYNNVSSTVKANVDDVMTLHHDDPQEEALPVSEEKE